MASQHDFRRLALAFPGAEEGAHMGHPDFRVGGKIFASLHAPEKGTGAVMLLPDQQELAMAAEPAFSPAAGAWGRNGSTMVVLAAVSDDWLERVLAWAWARRAPTGSPPGKRGVGGG